MAVKKKRYLLPIHHYGSGSNFNFEHFRMAALYALYTNRTIVEKWFYTHYSQERHAIGWKFLNETIDVDKLQELVGVAGIDEFRRNCNKTIDKVITTATGRADSEETYQKHVQLYKTEFGINILNWSHVDIIANPKNIFEEVSHIQCVGIYLPREFTLYKLPEQLDLLNLLDLHLIRPKNVRDAIDLVQRNVFHGKPFMALHFRTRAEEGCRDGMPNCDTTRKEAMRRSAISVSKDLRLLMKKRNISTIYVALPNYAMEYTNLFQKRLDNVLTRVDLVTMPTIAVMKDDNYMMSLVEQEICTRAELFVGWVYSYWSQMVIFQRNLSSRESINIKTLNGWDPKGLHLVKRKKK
ncbi:uncharacterized protein LOC144341670 [Saccoglossus kowalevskii]